MDETLHAAHEGAVEIDADPTPTSPPAAESTSEPQTPPQQVVIGLDLFERLLGTLQGNKRAEIEAQAEIHALAMKRAMRPSNELHPDVSAYNPEGERDHPRPELRCRMFFAKYPLNRDTLTLQEINLLNAIEPGIYQIHKSDNSVVQMTVSPQYDGTGTKLERLLLYFPATDDETKHNWPPLVQMLSEAIAQSAMQNDNTRMAAMTGSTIPRRTGTHYREVGL